MPSRGNPLFEDVSLYDHAADLAPVWNPGDDEWDDEIRRARELDAKGINPFTAQKE